MPPEPPWPVRGTVWAGTPSSADSLLAPALALNTFGKAGAELGSSGAQGMTYPSLCWGHGTAQTSGSSEGPWVLLLDTWIMIQLLLAQLWVGGAAPKPS